MSTLLVSGAGSPEWDGSYPEVGILNGKPYWQLDATHILVFGAYSVTGWQLRYELANDSESAYYSSGATPNSSDRAWNDLAGTAPVPTVSGYAVDSNDPTFASATLSASGTALAVTLNVPGTAPILPAVNVTGFSVRVAGVLVPVSSATAAGSVVTLTLAAAAFAGEAVTVAYAPGNVTDSAANILEAFAEQPVTNNSTQVAPAVVSAQRRLFSTGTLVANWYDGAILQSATFATLQDISFDISFQRAYLYDAAQISLFPVDSADSEGKVSLKASNATISADTLQRLVAATLTGILGAGTVTATLPRQVTLPPFQAVFTGMGTDGKTVVVTLGQVKAKGDSLALKLKDFAVENFTLDAYPDADGVVGTFAFEN